MTEDHDFLRRAITLALTHEGHDVIAAPSGRAATELLARQRFDVVLTDIQMRDGNGVELLEHVAQRQPDAYTIAMTAGAHTPRTPSARSRNFGARVLLRKPFPVNRLMAVLRSVDTPDESAPALESGASPN